MYNSHDIYIDLGTSNTVIYSKKLGFLLNQPSFVALDQRRTQPSIVHAGRSAQSMLGKTPFGVSVSRPLHEGVIADFDGTVRMLESFLAQLRKEVRFFRPRVVISLPCVVSNFERKSVEDAVLKLGASSVYLIDEPIAAALGAGLPVLDRQGSMVIDVGGGTTEIAVVSMGGIVACQAVRIGGNALDSEIMSHLRLYHHFAVGEQTAERLKKSVAHLDPQVEKTLLVGGQNYLKNLPSHKFISTSMIQPAVYKIAQEISRACLKTLEILPPEISADIATQGITLTGGGALIGGFGNFLSRELHVPVKVAQTPLMSVALGGARTLENNKLLDTILENARVS